MRKLIRSVAAAGFWSDEVNDEERDLTSKPLLQAARQSYWDRLLMGPGAVALFAEMAQFFSKILRVMRLCDDAETHDTAAPLRCQGRWPHLRRGQCRAFS